MKERSFQVLIKLAQIKLARDMASMGQVKARYQARAEERQRLKARTLTEFGDAQEAGIASQSAYGQWIEWSQHRRNKLLRQDESDTAALEDARAHLSRSFGETRALGLLLDRETARNRKLRAQRAERSGLPEPD